MTPEQAGQIRQFKILEERLLRLLDDMQAQNLHAMQERNEGICSGRWLAIGRTHIEQGFMALERSVEKPARFDLDNEDAAHA